MFFLDFHPTFTRDLSNNIVTNCDWLWQIGKVEKNSATWQKALAINFIVYSEKTEGLDSHIYTNTLTYWHIFHNDFSKKKNLLWKTINQHPRGNQRINVYVILVIILSFVRFLQLFATICNYLRFSATTHFFGATINGFHDFSTKQLRATLMHTIVELLHVHFYISTTEQHICSCPLCVCCKIFNVSSCDYILALYEVRVSFFAIFK